MTYSESNVFSGGVMNRANFKFLFLILFAVLLSACSNITRFEKPQLTAYADKVSETEEKRYFWISLKGNLEGGEFAKLRLQLLPSS